MMQPDRLRKMAMLILLMAMPVVWACQDEPLTTSGMADDLLFLVVDGQSLPVRVAGNLDNGKMLVIIHGGPGGNATDYRDDHVVENVEPEFAVVYWDQRFAGASQGNAGNTSITSFRDDMSKLILLLKSKYGNHQKIYLFGHSWGGFLVPYFLINETNQTMTDGWIQVCGAHNYLLNDSLTLEMLLHYGRLELEAERNSDTWQEIVDYCESHSYNESYEVAVQLNQYAHLAETLIPEVEEPEFDLGALPVLPPLTAHLMNGFISGIRQIDNPAYDEPISENLGKITLPTLLLWGKYDFVCPTGLMEDIRLKIGSKDVSERIFEQSGHSPMDNETAAFWQEVMMWVNSR